MKENLIEEIKLLIQQKMGKYKKKIDRSTALEHDLGITGDDAAELLAEYSDRFNVDVSKFNIGVYFMPEGDTILPSIISLFTGKKASKQKELTIGDLERGVIMGSLSEELIDGWNRKDA